MFPTLDEVKFLVQTAFEDMSKRYGEDWTLMVSMPIKRKSDGKIGTKFIIQIVDTGEIKEERYWTGWGIDS